MNSLIRVTIQNMTSHVLAFGIGSEKLLITFEWDVSIAIDIAAVES